MFAAGMFAAEPDREGTGIALLVEHLAALGRFDDARPSARERLEEELGSELARRLLGALTGDKAMRTAGRLVA